MKPMEAFDSGLAFSLHTHSKFQVGLSSTQTLPASQPCTHLPLTLQTEGRRVWIRELGFSLLEPCVNISFIGAFLNSGSRQGDVSERYGGLHFLASSTKHMMSSFGHWPLFNYCSLPSVSWPSL
jgi:hypothetical protein